MRCRNLGLKCHFEISMVGKCSRVRKRRRPTLVVSTSPGHGQHSDAEDTVVACAPSTLGSENSAAVVPPAQQDAGSPLLSGWTERTSFDLAAVTSSPSLILDDLRHNPMFGESALCEHDLAAFLSSYNDQCEPLFSLEGGLTTGHNVANRDDSIMSGASDTDPTDPTGQTDATVAQARQPSPHGVSQVTASQQGQQIQALTDRRAAASDRPNERTASLQDYFRMISCLEEQLKYRTSSVDEVMHTSKTCAEQLRASMQLDCFLCSTAGPMLILTAVELMTLLLESSIPRLLPDADSVSPPDDASASASTSSSSGTQKRAGAATLPSLALGTFRVDPEEVGLIWRHVISGELRRILRLIDAVGAHQENPPLRADRPSVRSAISYQVLCEGLKQRIKTMISSIGDSREGGRRLDMY